MKKAIISFFSSVNHFILTLNCVCVESVLCQVFIHVCLAANSCIRKNSNRVSIKWECWCTTFFLLQKIIKDRDEERERLRRELQRSREQLHVMHESHRRNQLNASASPSHSRPNSLISQEGLCEPHHDSEDDTG